MSIFQNISGSLLPIAGFQVADAMLDITSEQPIQNSAVTNAVNVINDYGCKNLLRNTATTQVKNGITFTVNSDGSVLVNGTASSAAILNLYTGANILKQGNYILNGCPANGAIETYRLDVICYYASDEIAYADYGEGCAFTINGNETEIAFRIRVADGATISNLTFYPMIRDARVQNDSYVPYAMSNKQITDFFVESSSAFYKKTDYTWLTINKQNLVNLGSLTVLSLTFTVTEAKNASDMWIGMVDTKYLKNDGRRLVGTICVNNTTETVGCANMPNTGYLFITANLQTGKEYSLTVAGC